MENCNTCKSCKKRGLVMDFISGGMVCSSCGIVQDFDSYENNCFDQNGPTGTFIKIGTAGTSTEYNFKQTKIYKAMLELGHITTVLGISESRKEKVKEMVDKITEGEFGQGNWLSVCIGACCYVVMRQDEKSLSISEVASKVDCDVNELGRMVKRVLNFLELKLLPFDMVGSFEKGFRTCFDESGIGKDMVSKMMKQGVFLVQCLVKWWVTTGRRPLPVIVAVLVFVAQLNSVDVSINDVAMSLHAAVLTCKLRYKELLERLVEVAQNLPWGKDITVKNIVKNAPFVIQYMELKSISKNKRQEKSISPISPDLHNLDDLVGQCLSSKGEYRVNNDEMTKDSRYFELESKNSSFRLDADDLGEFKISHECLSLLYSEFSTEVTDAEPARGNRRKRKLEVDSSQCFDWWNGKSQLSKKLVLKKILEQDVGLNTMPPSFVSGCLAITRRREKIDAAKLRIGKIMNPHYSGLSQNEKPFLVRCTSTGKRRRKSKLNADWEDLIIETLLLHQVDEEEIKKGHYNTLLELHVFN